MGFLQCRMPMRRRLLLPHRLRAKRLQLHLQVQNPLLQLRTLNPPIRHILLRQVHPRPRVLLQLLIHPLQVRLLRLNLRPRPLQVLNQLRNRHLLQHPKLRQQRLPRLNPPNNPPRQKRQQREPNQPPLILQR
jgi:hypothetical protein